MATSKIKKYYEDDTLIIADKGFLPSKLSDLADDATHRTVTDTEKSKWNAKEDASNKSNDIATDASSTTKYPSVKAIKDYADSLVIGLTDLRGEYNASVNTFPATGGSGTAGAILKGDVWLISVEGTLGGVLHKVGDAIIAITDTPGQTAGNWGHLNSGLGFVPENVSNKVTTFQVTPDDTHYASEKLVKDSLDAKEDSLPATPTNPDISFLNGNKEWATISVGAGGYGAPLYFTTIASDVSGYKKISYTGESSLTELTGVVNNEEKLLRTYLYDYTLDTTVIDAGPWIASFRVKVSNATGITKLKLEPFLYHADTTETTLFSTYSSELNNTDYAVIRNESPQGVFNCLSTDRLGVRVYASTTANTNITVYTTVGDGDASYFTTPLAIRHDLLRNKAWTTSGHTGTALTVAGFLASTGVATEYALGIANGNIALIDDASVADNDYAKFTATGIEGVPYATVLSDIGALPLTGGTLTGDLYGTNINYNEGLLSDPTITDATGVAISITSVDCLIRSNSTWDGDKKLYKKTVPENTSLAVTDDSINYIYVTWNSGNPIYAATTNRDVLNNSDAIPVARVYMSGGNIEYQLLYEYLGRSAAIRNFDRVMRIRGSAGIERESGLSLSETATRVINIESGAVWFGLKRITSSTLTTIAQGGSGVTSHLWYHSGGVWTETTISQYNNTQYDNGTDLATLTSNRYAVNWVFRNITKNEIDVVLGRGDYTLAQAEASTVPPLPTAISNFYVLCGRIIVQKGSNTAYTIENVSTSTFNQATVSSHPDLSNLTWTTSGHTGTASTIAGFLASTGVASEYTLSGTGTQIALTNSPSFTTPNIGSATGSASLNLLLTGGTLTGALNIEHADGLVLGKDVTGGSSNIAGKIKMFSSGDDALYNTFTSGDNTANATYTLPTAMPAVSGYVLSCTDAGVMSWGAAGGLTWGDSITSTSGTGITTTVANSSDAGTIGQRIVIGNTQTNATTGLKIDTGTSAKGNTGLYIQSYNASTTAKGIDIISSSASTGSGLTFSGNSQGEGYRRIDLAGTINNTAGSCYGIKFGSLNNSSGIGYGLYITSADATTTSRGVFFSLNNSQSGNLDARSLDMSEIISSRTDTLTSGTKTDNYNILNIKRTTIKNGAGGTYLAQGSVLKLENVATQTAGTLTDTVTPLLVVQDADSTGNIVSFKTGTTEYFGVSSAGNILINSATGETGSVGVLCISNGTAPDAHVDNQIQIYSVDSSNSTATLGLYLEQAVEDIGTFTESHKIKIYINGTAYYISLDAV